MRRGELVQVVLVLTVLLLLKHPGGVESINVLTQNYNEARTGWNNQEVILSPEKVNSTDFGALFRVGFEADVCGQPLYVENFKIKSGLIKNVLFVYTATNNDNSPSGVWCIDADTGVTYWHTKLHNNARFTTNTPTIDPDLKFLYFISKYDNDRGMNYIHAINLTSGEEAPGSPQEVEGSVPGTGAGSRNGRVYFEDAAQDCRPGMLYFKGMIFHAYAFNTDQGNYHGWLFAHEYNPSQQKFIRRIIWNNTPNGQPGGGIWMAGKGIATDGTYVYLSTGNGDFFPNIESWGMTVLKLDISNDKVTVVDYFSPMRESEYSDEDKDLGNCGVLIIPNTNLLFIGSTKYGEGYLMNSSNMGKHYKTKNDCLQTLKMTGSYEVGQNPVVFGAGGQGVNELAFIYLWSDSENLMQYRFEYLRNRIVPGTPYRVFEDKRGGSLGISSLGNKNGILWAAGNDGILRAFDAVDITKPLLFSSAWRSRDTLGSIGHFQFPLVVNGKVYVGTGQSGLVAYALLR